MKNLKDFSKQDYLEWAYLINAHLTKSKERQDTLFFLLQEQQKNMESTMNVVEILERRIDYLALKIKEDELIAEKTRNTRNFS
jgi:cell division protein FtsB